MVTEGLTATEAQKRARAQGPNTLEYRPPRSTWSRLVTQFRNPLIIVLLVAGVVTAIVGDYVDSVVIFAVVVINALIGWIQEGRAQRALEAVSALLVTEATVIRDGRRQVIDAEEIVRGDSIVIEAGDRIAADGILHRAHALRVEESILTGESVPVEKSAEGDREVFAGTLVVSGHAIAEVTAIGAATRMGRIGGLIDEADSIETPLTRRLDRFAWQITIVILVTGALAWVLAVFVRNFDMIEAFLAVIGLAVAAIPEGLPAIISIVLAIGTQSMARRRAVIRRLPSVETLGSVDVICTDKTGTLTRNEMTVVELLLPCGDVEVSGAGYAPDGELILEQRIDAELLSEQARHLCVAAISCNDAEWREEEGDWVIIGDPTEGALFPLAAKAGVDVETVLDDSELLDEIPFNPDARYMASLRRTPEGRVMLFVKGAPEVVLSMCEEMSGDWATRGHESALAGRRLLAIAERECASETKRIDASCIKNGLTLLGMSVLMDPPRPEAAESISQCHSAGIRVIMITGDHAVTASSIGRSLGLADQEAVTGEQIDAATDEQVRSMIQSTDVVARASPETKMRLISLLQADGRTVAMTGDGVNDAPALQRADIGVAMGLRGTDAARDSADVILTDDNFATIARAVRQGRVVYDNIIKSLQFILPTNGGEAGLILLALLLGITLPVTVGQILWVNLVTTVTLALAFAFEPASRGVMSRSPRRRDEGLITRHVLLRIVFVSVLMVAVSLAAFEFGLRHGESLEFARTMTVTMIVLAEVAYLFNVRRLSGSSLGWGTFAGNPVANAAVGILMIVQLGFIYLPLMQDVFDTAPLDSVSWLVLLGLAAAFFLSVEGVKFFLRRREKVEM